MKKLILFSLIICSIFFSISSAVAEDLAFEDFIYNILPDGNVEIKRYNGSDEIIEIPAEIEGIPVTSIGKSAFSESTSVPPETSRV